jgi:hypothetical protein
MSVTALLLEDKGTESMKTMFEIAVREERLEDDSTGR